MSAYDAGRYAEAITHMESTLTLIGPVDVEAPLWFGVIVATRMGAGYVLANAALQLNDRTKAATGVREVLDVIAKLRKISPQRWEKARDRVTWETWAEDCLARIGQARS